ncbi:MAG: tetratricopeptide repeat protein [Bacteroidetes bacterium]|nr:tetratricopeptide repeat protein [Bacteroidota bacterium]
MNKIKAVVLFLVTVVAANMLKAQSIEDGKKFMYYEKYISAKKVFEQLLAANPNNTDAAYWLGQCLISGDNKDIPAAKELYRKTLEANSNNALLTAGMGHIELLEGKTQDARNRFETAISLSQGKNIAVLNAIGAANADYDIKNGDANYAIEKLKQATTLKGFKDPETYCLMGDAYRRLTDGGNAQKSYESALGVASNYARAKFRIGNIYQTQGKEQEDIYMRYYNDAIAMDANYTPVYYQLYLLLYNTNVNKSGEYLEKYLSLMGQDEPQACYYRATIKFAQGLFAESITQADACIASGGANPDPRLYGLKAYAYLKLNDTANAKTAFEKFFQLQKPEKIGPTDYLTYGKILQKTPGNEAQATQYFEKAVAADTVETSKINTIKEIGAGFEDLKSYTDAGYWYSKVLAIKKAPSKTDYYNAAYNYYRGGKYEEAVTGWSGYLTNYPDDIFGYYMTAIAQNKIDTSFTLGLAVPNYQKVVDLGEAQWATDSVKVKSHLMNAYKFFIQYTYNGQHDPKAASEWCARYLAKDPTDAEVQKYKDAFDAMAAKPAPPAKPAAPAKSSGGTKPAKGTATTTKPATGGGTKTPAKKK